MARNVDGWLARKYGIEETTASANARDAYARAGLVDAQAQQEPANAAAQRAAQYGAGAAGLGSGALSRANAAAVPGLAGSEIGLRSAQTGLAGAQTGEAAAQAASAQALTDFLGTGNPIIDQFTRNRTSGTQGYPNSSGIVSLNPAPITPGAPITGRTTMFGGAFGPSQLGTYNPAPAAPAAPSTGSFSGMQTIQPGAGLNPDGTPKYSKGTAKVPGSGSPKVDSVDASLAPGEAVLNAAAAEHLGRNTIALLNAIGEQKMGLGMEGDAGTDTEDTRAKPDGSTPTTANRPGYKAGTAKVPAKGASPKAPGKPSGKPPAGKGGGDAHISPKLLAALMAGGGGQAGVGMPSPQGQQPMPMPMPQMAPQQ